MCQSDMNDAALIPSQFSFLDFRHFPLMVEYKAKQKICVVPVTQPTTLNFFFDCPKKKFPPEFSQLL